MGAPGWPGWTPPRPKGPSGELGHRFGARAIDASIELVAAVGIVLAMEGSHRPWATVFLIAVAITVYETVMVAVWGATIGKVAVGLRVVELDRRDGVSWRAALRRGAVVGPMIALVVPAIGLLGSVSLSSLHRGVQDRVAGTYVVERRLATSVDRAALATIGELELLALRTRWGWAAPLSSRRRGRLHRLDDSPLLVVVLLVLALAATFVDGLVPLLLLTAGPWIVFFVFDETRRIARTGQDAGHRQNGLVVIDIATGEPPSPGRSFVRALFLGLALYVPVAGWLLLLLPDVITLISTGDHRAIHDLLARTVVVVDPRLAPEEQRLAALAVDVDALHHSLSGS